MTTLSCPVVAGSPGHSSANTTQLIIMMTYLIITFFDQHLMNYYKL